jgi:peptidoglycan LD-endopeptidase CwlK
MRSIETLHPVIKAKALALQKRAQERFGLRVIITECLRTDAEQVALYAQGRKSLDEINNLRKIAGWGPIGEAQAKQVVTKAPTATKSYHGYGLAFDIAITSPDGKHIEWSDKADWNQDGLNDWEQVGELAAACGLEWGGNWSSFPDIPHYQFTFGRTIASLIADKTVIAGNTIKIPYTDADLLVA